MRRHLGKILIIRAPPEKALRNGELSQIEKQERRYPKIFIQIEIESVAHATKETLRIRKDLEESQKRKNLEK